MLELDCDQPQCVTVIVSIPFGISHKICFLSMHRKDEEEEEADEKCEEEKLKFAHILLELSCCCCCLHSYRVWRVAVARTL